MASHLILQLNSQNHWLSDGVQTSWNFNFAGGYINKSHVKVYHQSPAGVRTDIVIDVDTDFIGPYQIVLPVVTAGHTLVIYRDTPKNVPLVDFADGANIDEVSLDIVAQQGVFVAAETADFLGATSVGDIIDLVQQAADSSNQAIASAAAAATSATSSAGSAATASDASSTAVSAASDATISATAANGSAGAAASSATTAGTAATSASGFATAASGSAASAVSSASAASGSSTAAAGSATAASGSATAAAGSATSASNSAIAAAASAAAAINATPIGMIGLWAGTTPPTGWVKRNGALLSRASYPDLWAVAAASGNIISDASWLGLANPGSFSTGDGSTTFRVPDGRGLTDKGYHDGSGTFTTNTARALGSYEADGNKAHNHGIAVFDAETSIGGVADGGGSYDGRVYTDNEGNAEATVRNAVYLPIIRAF